MIQLGYNVAENKRNIATLDKNTVAMQEEIAALKAKINEVNELRQLIKVSRVTMQDQRLTTRHRL